MARARHMRTGGTGDTEGLTRSRGAVRSPGGVLSRGRPKVIPAMSGRTQCVFLYTVRLWIQPVSATATEGFTVPFEDFKNK